jgi:hypothetical protein
MVNGLDAKVSNWRLCMVTGGRCTSPSKVTCTPAKEKDLKTAHSTQRGAIVLFQMVIFGGCL